MSVLTKSMGSVDVTKVPLSLKGVVMLVIAFAVIFLAASFARPLASFLEGAVGRVGNAARGAGSEAFDWGV